MIIRKAHEGDLEAIQELEDDAFGADERWSANSWSAELSGADRCVLVRLAAAGEVIGVASFNCVAGLADLNRVIVHLAHRGQGIAASLVRAGMDWAAALGGERMLLEVDPENMAAVRLYRKLGFEQISRRRHYYAAGRDALVMAQELTDEDQWAVRSA